MESHSDTGEQVEGECRWKESTGGKGAQVEGERTGGRRAQVEGERTGGRRAQVEGENRWKGSTGAQVEGVWYTDGEDVFTCTVGVFSCSLQNEMGGIFHLKNCCYALIPMTYDHSLNTHCN